MARFNFDGDNSMGGGSTSQYNEAFLKMTRIHKLQDTINLCNLNLVAINPELQVYNYEVVISCCEGILKEVWSKLDKDERVMAMNFKDAVKKILKENPIHEQVKDYTTRNTYMKLNEIHWRVLEKWIYKFDLLCRELLGTTGYDSPNKDDWDGL